MGQHECGAYSSLFIRNNPTHLWLLAAAASAALSSPALTQTNEPKVIAARLQAGDTVRLVCARTGPFAVDWKGKPVLPTKAEFRLTLNAANQTVDFDAPESKDMLDIIGFPSAENDTGGGHHHFHDGDEAASKVRRSTGFRDVVTFKDIEFQPILFARERVVEGRSSAFSSYNTFSIRDQILKIGQVNYGGLEAFCAQLSKDAVTGAARNAH